MDEKTRPENSSDKGVPPEELENVAKEISENLSASDNEAELADDKPASRLEIPEDSKPITPEELEEDPAVPEVSEQENVEQESLASNPSSELSGRAVDDGQKEFLKPLTSETPEARDSLDRSEASAPDDLEIAREKFTGESDVAEKHRSLALDELEESNAVKQDLADLGVLPKDEEQELAQPEAPIDSEVASAPGLEMPPMPDAPSVPETPIQEPIPPMPDAPAPESVQTEQPAAQYYQAPDAAYGSDPGDSFSGYLDGLKSVITAPQRLINGLSQDIVKALIFISISLAAVSLVQVMVTVLGVMKANSTLQDTTSSFGITMSSTKIDMNGDWWGNVFKGVGLQALYAVGFIFLIAGVIWVISLIAKKQFDFIKSFGLTSVLAINFIAGAIAGLLGLFSLYFTGMATFVQILVSCVVGIAFIYSSVLLIQGIVERIGISYFVSVVIYVVTVVFGLWILGNMFKDYSTYFNVSFGSFGNSSFSSSLSSLSKAMNDLQSFDISNYLK